MLLLTLEHSNCSNMISHYFYPAASVLWCKETSLLPHLCPSPCTELCIALKPYKSNQQEGQRKQREIIYWLLEAIVISHSGSVSEMVIDRLAQLPFSEFSISNTQVLHASPTFFIDSAVHPALWRTPHWVRDHLLLWQKTVTFLPKFSNKTGGCFGLTERDFFFFFTTKR